jgi:hypothetical protein
MIVGAQAGRRSSPRSLPLQGAYRARARGLGERVRIVIEV